MDEDTNKFHYSCIKNDTITSPFCKNSDYWQEVWMNYKINVA